MYKTRQAFSEIAFSKLKERTVLTKNYCLPPLKVINSNSNTHASYCFVTNYGAGFVEGDQVVLHIKAHEDTHSVITTQGNTRVYKSHENRCSQIIEGLLKKNAFHVFLNDPVVLHSDAAFLQKSTWALDKNAVLLLVDWFSAGRVQNNEAFTFRYYQTETKILVAGQPVLWDRFHIDPEQEDVTSPGSFNCNTTYLNIFLVGHQEDSRVACIEKHLNRLNNIFTSSGNLDSRTGIGVVGSSTRQNQYACFSRFASPDVLHLHKVMADLVTILDNEILLGFNPLGNRYGVEHFQKLSGENEFL
jgi:urease accessory protein